ncbi:hypothetical protein TKK_0013515 [Trichogramma kaykai]|uniref:DUF4371 domain-containing protein n=1 Tax=Trichogramma kaykai TaxID=54128 RepID=A0ABD2WIK8_9HYME
MSNISSQFSQLSTNNTDDDIYYEPPAKLKKNENVCGTMLASALDRCGISDRQAALILNAASVDRGAQDASTTKIRSCLRRKRKRVRDEIKTNVEDLSFDPVTVHWDGKTLKRSRDNCKVEILPVVVSSGSDEQLLSCPFLAHGTGEEIGTAVQQSLDLWKIKNIKSMCYDTTSTNTGIHSGACKILEEKLETQLLNASCRHHVAELVLGVAFEHYFPSISKSPDITFLKNFRETWTDIDKEKFHTVSSIRIKSLKVIITQKKDDISQEINRLLSLGKQMRSDYDELLQLASTFLGTKSPKQFKMPGGNHRARWMSKAIYTLKMCLFRKQLSLTDEQQANLQKMSVFIVFLYIPYWYNTRLPCEAATSDLKLLKNLEDYKKVDFTLSTKVIDKFSNHLWYLSKELVCISLFSDKVDNSEKKKMIKNLKKRDDSERELKAKININNIKKIGLADFFTEKSMHFFTITGITPSFLNENPERWAQNTDFINGKNFCLKLQVVNDAAERAVALGTRFFDKLTQDKKQWQKMLLNVFKDLKSHKLN